MNQFDYTVGDKIDDLRNVLNEASSKYDLISNQWRSIDGDWDLVRKIMEEEGDLHFLESETKTWFSTLFGLWNNTPIFGLPGNPVSSHVVFRMLVHHG